jgi:hypothetical protein
MADNRSYYGFRPYIGDPNGGVSFPQTVRKWVATGADHVDDGAVSMDLNIGDPVKLVNDGSVLLAVGGDIVWGIVAGFEYYWDGDFMRPTNKLPNQNAWGTVEERRPWVHVIPARACWWEIDVDDNTTATTKAAYLALVGENCEFTCAGDTSTLKASPLADISTHATTQDHSLRIEGISDSRNNEDFSGERVKIIVSFNDTSHAGQAATVITGT